MRYSERTSRRKCDIKEGSRSYFNRKSLPKICNGLQGVVTGFEDNMPVVKFVNGFEITVKKYTWLQQIDRRMKGKKTFSGVAFEQIPLIPAWTITTHKSQGMTIKYLKIDLSVKNFEVGQAYVVLS